MRKLREILGQPEFSTVVWDKNKALLEYKAWYDKYGCTPGASRQHFRRGERNISEDEANLAAGIDYAASKYVGGARKVCELLGIKHSQQWNKKKALEELKGWHDKYHCTPPAALGRLRLGRMKMSREEADRASSLSSAVLKYLGGNIRACELLDIKHQIQWNKKRVLKEYKEWYDKYGCTPDRAYNRFRSGQISISNEEAKRASRLSSAVYKYVGGNIKACELLGIKPSNTLHKVS